MPYGPCMLGQHPVLPCLCRIWCSLEVLKEDGACAGPSELAQQQRRQAQGSAAAAGRGGPCPTADHQPALEHHSRPIRRQSLNSPPASAMGLATLPLGLGSIGHWGRTLRPVLLTDNMQECQWPERPERHGFCCATAKSMADDTAMLLLHTPRSI